jgi:peptidoglycan hydrolase CwlO-like protein
MKVVGVNVAITLGIICVVLAACLVGAVANYTRIIGEKDEIIASKDSEIEVLKGQRDVLQRWLDGNISAYTSQISSLNSQMSSLQSQISLLNATISSLNSQIALKDAQISALSSQRERLQTWLEGNMTLLNSLKLERERLSVWLEGNRTLLAQAQAWLQGNITYYESQISKLNSQIKSLQSEIDSLKAQMSASLQAYMDAYQRLRDKVNQRWNHMNVEPFITPQDQAVRNIVYSITGGWSNPSDWNEYWRDVKAMYSWVVDNIEYRYDGLYPILPYNPSEALGFANEMWQFPNETLSLRKGDCEDMAILLCSMIRCYNNMKYRVECIAIESSTSGHVAVQMPVAGYELIILDPAGKYYSHDIWGNIASNDINVEINSWLNYWKPQMGGDVHVTRVFSDYIDKTFTSTSEYLAWMYSR